MSEETGEACAFDNADELVVAVEDTGADTPEQDALVQSLLATIPALIAAHPSPQGELVPIDTCMCTILNVLLHVIKLVVPGRHVSP